MYSMKHLLAWICCLAWPALALALDGRVTDAATGLPIAGAIVLSGHVQATSDANGHYALPVSPPRLLARAIGYARASISVVSASGTAPPIALHALRPKALYLSAYGIGDKRLREAALKLLDTTELNALVIDLKSDRGQVPYPTQVLEATRCGARSVTTVHDMRALVTQLKDQGVYLIARIVAFKDELSASAHPEWRVKDARGQPFHDNEQLSWLDPFCQDGWAYLIDLAEEAADMGFDEVQFDYVRFPDTGKLQFARPNTEAARVEAITGFLEAARKRLARYNVFLSADIFGYVAWNKNDTNIGQELTSLAGVVDYLAPMLYPSGYQFGIPGYPNPVAHPGEIVYLTLRHAIARTRISPLRFRPWLQAFRDYAFDKRVFGAAEIRAQIDAAESAGSDGWMLWNPRNTYTADGLHPR